jgi:hypothetical protein
MVDETANSLQCREFALDNNFGTPEYITFNSEFIATTLGIFGRGCTGSI